MTSLLSRLDSQLKDAMRARVGLRVEALRTLKAALYGARDETELRTLLGRYRSRCVEMLQGYAQLGTAAETVADRLVLDVGVCDALLPPLTGDETATLVRALARTLPRRAGQGAVEALIGLTMRAAPGQLDGTRVRALAAQTLGQS